MRRHNIDNLRVLVFVLLIIYHVTKFFDTGNFHLKNNQVYDFLEEPQYFLNRWRLAILFVISGIGTYYAIQNYSAFKFSGQRLKRLLLPLIFGMLFIVPPQVYIERFTMLQFDGSYLDFWPAYAFEGEYPKGNLSWHHLWFLPYLLVYTFIWLPVFFYLKKHPVNKFNNWLKFILKKPIGIYWFCIPLILVEFLLEPYFPQTHALIGDWYVLVKFFLLFGYGFLLMGVKEVLWETLVKYRRIYLGTAVFAFILLYISVWVMDDTLFSYYLELTLIPVNYWSWILTIFGFSAKYLNQTNSKLRYANEAVYPFYILH